VVREAPRADLGRVLLVGHSRGGEGVNRAALEATTGAVQPWTVRGVVHLAPTAFGQNPAPGVPVVVLLPSCDGDVYDLEGQAYLDAARDAGGRVASDPVLRSAVLVVGANHNFFNREWTPGEASAPAWDDGWGSGTACQPADEGGGRLSPPAQRGVADVYVAAAASALVGGRVDALPLIDGTPVRSRSLDGVRVLVQALGGRRTPAVVPSRATRPTASGAVQARLCHTVGEPSCAGDGEDGPAMPHFLPVLRAPDEEYRDVAEIRWARPAGTSRIALSRPAALRAANALELRLAAVPQPDGPTLLDVRVVDSHGRRARLGEVRLPAVLSKHDSAAYLARQVRLPLDGLAGGVDLSSLSALELVPRSASGQVWLLDAWGWRPGLSSEPGLRLPRVDLGHVSRPEGSAPHVVNVPLSVTAGASSGGRVRVVAYDPTTFHEVSTRLVTIPVGARSVPVPVLVNGDEREDEDVLTYDIAVQAVRGVTTGMWANNLQVLDDDPAPTVTVTGPSHDVVEGQVVSFAIRLSAPSDRSYFVDLTLTAPDGSGGTELDTADVPGQWLLDRGLLEPPSSPVPLSQAGLWLSGWFDVQQTEIRVDVPTRSDAVDEGPERVALRVASEPDQAPLSGLDEPVLRTASVTDAP
jgi:hypothetical protein